MLIKNVTEKNLENALKEINKRYDGNIVFDRLDGNSKRNHWNVTLKVKDTHAKGSAINTTYMLHKRNCESNKGIFKHGGRACWHVHGDFFDALLAIAPEAEISTMFTKVINRDGGNWEDNERGSLFTGTVMQSELCDCNDWREE